MRVPVITHGTINPFCKGLFLPLCGQIPINSYRIRTTAINWEIFLVKISNKDENQLPCTKIIIIIIM